MSVNKPKASSSATQKKGLIANFGGQYRDTPCLITVGGIKILLWKGRGDRLHIDAPKEVQIILPNHVHNHIVTNEETKQ